MRDRLHHRLLRLILILMVMGAAGILHLRLGATSIDWSDVRDAVFRYSADMPVHNIVIEMRLPRFLAAVMVGAALGLSGLLMQGLTNNPLADPGVMGVNAGASFFVVVGLAALPGATLAMIPWLAGAGALTAAGCVMLNAGPGSGPSRLVLTGVMVGALFSAMTTAVLLLDQQGLETLRRWLVGSLAFDSAQMRRLTLPLLALAGLIAVANIPALNLFRLGERSAALMGLDVARLRLTTLCAVVLAAASAVSIAGPIGFVGFVAPNLARLFFGTDFRWLVPATPLLGALLLVLGDIVSRVAVRPLELNTGIVTALIGGPVFILLVLRRVR
ncbi:FecCD family ABC transporter permease [Salipiger thiooxidans]|uniref:FecCD family ABC transporter permease n=1 Tax=Salipiger thiooxidans TaxID=282683 RepID=UPI001CD6C988|nr:iron ABC transporter permease [Salipiger thiooxidans]MCA0849791.1 iron ABC transporter permease [Salipiger thiooxidans]